MSLCTLRAPIGVTHLLVRDGTVIVPSQPGGMMPQPRYLTVRLPAGLQQFEGLPVAGDRTVVIDVINRPQDLPALLALGQV